MLEHYVDIAEGRMVLGLFVRKAELERSGDGSKVGCNGDRRL